LLPPAGYAVVGEPGIGDMKAVAELKEELLQLNLDTLRAQGGARSGAG
jgi:hypothetical protein